MCILCGYMFFANDTIVKLYAENKCHTILQCKIIFVGFELKIKTCFVIHGSAHTRVSRTHDHAAV